MFIYLCEPAVALLGVQRIFYYNNFVENWLNLPMRES